MFPWAEGGAVRGTDACAVLTGAVRRAAHAGTARSNAVIVAGSAVAVVRLQIHTYWRIWHSKVRPPWAAGLSWRAVEVWIEASTSALGTHADAGSTHPAAAPAVVG